MAGLRAVALTNAEVALVASTEKTVLQLRAAANHPIKVTGYGCYFDGVAATDPPVLVKLVRQTTDGTMTQTGVSNNKMDDARDETLQTGAWTYGSAEPTLGAVLKPIQVHPQSGYEYLAPDGHEVMVPGGGRIALAMTAGANVNVVPWISYEE